MRFVSKMRWPNTVAPPHAPCIASGRLPAGIRATQTSNVGETAEDLPGEAVAELPEEADTEAESAEDVEAPAAEIVEPDTSVPDLTDALTTPDDDVWISIIVFALLLHFLAGHLQALLVAVPLQAVVREAHDHQDRRDVDHQFGRK